MFTIYKYFFPLMLAALVITACSTTPKKISKEKKMTMTAIDRLVKDATEEQGKCHALFDDFLLPKLAWSNGEASFPESETAAKEIMQGFYSKHVIHNALERLDRIALSSGLQQEEWYYLNKSKSKLPKCPVNREYIFFSALLQGIEDYKWSQKFQREVKNFFRTHLAFYLKVHTEPNYMRTALYSKLLERILKNSVDRKSLAHHRTRLSRELRARLKAIGPGRMEFSNIKKWNSFSLEEKKLSASLRRHLLLILN